nr:helix-turn-helix domain-containing protein [Bifidobacterium dentium]
MLSSTLKELINDGLVVRKQRDEIPPRVEYSLTDRGKSVVPILQNICKWAGIFQRESSDNMMAQCHKCDYNRQ